MDNQKDHINPWAKKLEEAATPENDGWSSMEILLDRNMPVKKRKESRRWVLLTIFLFLLMGVCNCPGIKTSNNIAIKQNQSTKEDSIQIPSRQTFISKNNNPTKDAESLTENKTHSGRAERETEKFYKNNVRDAGNNQISAISKGAKNIKNKKSKTDVDETASGQQIITEVESSPAKDSLAQTVTTTKKDSSLTDLHAGGKSAEKSNTASPDKKPSEKTPDEDKKGFVFTLGLNQFFPVGTQDKTNYNSNGTTGGISDYIPVPAGRYYFHNWLYLEAELQINSPQYTSSLLVGQKIGYSTGQPLVQSVYIKKLFYFNVPLSIHFSPVKNLFFGAGIQYSRLTNGVALYQESNYTSGYVPNRPINDTGLIYSEVREFKHDTSYQKLKTDEWRFLLDVNYQWKRLTLGLRYNQAFNNFVNVQVSSGTITQAHNSSFQLYLQYMLWDHRKKIKKAIP